ncbi:hypothetical protein D1610_01670 [Sphingomonas gilva]|uniref:Uncharacterized protein n=1 Tax=Sphingomonas gilva TaxID=2305907 RepID=A0A396RR67_9SPHN|nr:hypothetical protein [Sphingomonas gilva]RHW18879.1 hypothetical protein D1610_01670 [Sphingomonas gilva]
MEDPGKVKTDAGQDKDIAERLERNPESKEARLDTALDESMDASDPPASTQPIHRHSGPAPSSGYDEKKETALNEHGGDHSREHAKEAERQQDA